jgi:DNA-binding transcriptional LysR family regulator
VIETARGLERVAAELEGGWEPELHVVVDGALPMEPFLRCLRRFSDPEVPTFLRLDVEYQEGVVERFHEAPADLAMVLGLAFDGDEVGYDCSPLEPLELVLVASANHPLATGSSDELERQKHAEIVVRDSSSRFSKRSKASFIGSKNVVFLSDFHSKRIALLEEAGYGWVPRHLIQDELESGRLVLLDTEPNSWVYHPQMLTRSGHALGKGAQLFVETMTGR